MRTRGWVNMRTARARMHVCGALRVCVCAAADAAAPSVNTRYTRRKSRSHPLTLKTHTAMPGIDRQRQNLKISIPNLALVRCFVTILSVIAKIAHRGSLPPTNVARPSLQTRHSLQSIPCQSCVLRDTVTPAMFGTTSNGPLESSKCLSFNRLNSSLPDLRSSCVG